jgi:hypothetical protein
MGHGTKRLSGTRWSSTFSSVTIGTVSQPVNKRLRQATIKTALIFCGESALEFIQFTPEFPARFFEGFRPLVTNDDRLVKRVIEFYEPFGGFFVVPGDANSAISLACNLVDPRFRRFGFVLVSPHRDAKPSNDNQNADERIEL